MFNKDNIPDLIVNQIEDMIIQGKIKPGDQLPSELEMSQQLGVGKSSVREALAALEYKNIVKRTKDGVFINENGYEYANKNLSFHFLLKKEHFLELLELREILEFQLVKLAIKNATQEDLESIGQTLEDTGEDFNKFKEKDDCFHLAIAEAAQNNILLQTYYKIKDLFNSMNCEADLQEAQQILQEHKEIYASLQAKDEAMALSCMKKHLDNTRQIYISSFGEI